MSSLSSFNVGSTTNTSEVDIVGVGTTVLTQGFSMIVNEAIA
jgi:hypothetical protein